MQLSRGKVEERIAKSFFLKKMSVGILVLNQTKTRNSKDGKVGR